ncbi:MAG TPA: hypothetical protein VGO93_09285, partial [Candidatus Xenobia bacterium]
MRRRGNAVMAGLLITFFVLVLALSLFELIRSESSFEHHQEAQERAYLAALSGLELFKAEA